jgi:hypothetical protein
MRNCGLSASGTIRNYGLKASRKECGMVNYGLKAFRKRSRIMDQKPRESNAELWAKSPAKRNYGLKASRKECGIMG